MDDAGDRHRLTSRDRRRLAVLPSEWTRLRPPFRPSTSPFVSSPRVATIRRCHLRLFPPVTFDIFSKRHSHAQIARRKKKKKIIRCRCRSSSCRRGGQGRGKGKRGRPRLLRGIFYVARASRPTIQLPSAFHATLSTKLICVHRTMERRKKYEKKDEKVCARFNWEEQTCESGAYRNVVDGYIYDASIRAQFTSR